MKKTPRSKQDMVSAMGVYIIEMRTELTRAGIPPEALQIPDGWEHVPITIIREAYYWILQVYQLQFNDCQSVRQLLSGQLWEKYENWGGFDDLREMIMLRKTHKNLKKEYYGGRTTFFKKTIVSKIIREKTKKKKARHHTIASS